VELHNTSGHRITLTGSTLRDKQNNVYKFGTYKIKAHGYVKIHTGKGPILRPTATGAAIGMSGITTRIRQRSRTTAAT
jgi:hypothetical protein